MALEKINFEYTSQIQRYLDEMISYWNENRENMPKRQIQFAEPLEIRSYLRHEYGNEADEDNRRKFLGWLETTNAVEFIYHTEDEGHLAGEEEYVTYPATFHAHVRDINPVCELYKRFTDTKSEIVSKDNSRLLYFNEADGKFLCGKHRLELKNR